MFFSFSPTEILYISSRVLLHVFRFNFSFCVNNGLERKRLYQSSCIKTLYEMSNKQLLS